MNEDAAKALKTGEKRIKHPYWVWESIQMIPDVLAKCFDKEVQDQIAHIAEQFNKRGINKIFLVGTGSSYFATIAEKYLFEDVVGIPVWRFVANIFRNYPSNFIDSKSIVFFHSHSGKTAGDNEAVEFAKSKGAYTIGVTDIASSDLAKAVDDVFIGPGGSKIELPATRTYATAIFRMSMLSLAIANILGNKKIVKKYQLSIEEYPKKVKYFMSAYEKIAASNVEKIKDCTSFISIGCGPNLSTADEGALAFNQCAWVPAQSFELENFIHGPMQTLTKKVGVIAIANPGPLQSRVLKTAKAAKIIGAKIILLVPEGTNDGIDADVRIELPQGIPDLLSPVLYMVPLWQTAYHFYSLQRGSHPDRLSMDKPEFKDAFSYLMKKDEKWVSI